MAVGIAVHCRELTPALAVASGESRLVYLRAVLKGRRPYLERSRVEVLIKACAVIPSLSDGAVEVERELLQAEVVRLVVESAVESFLSQLRERVDGISYVSGSDCRLRDFEQSHMAHARVRAPVGVDRVRIGGVGDGQSVLQHIHVGRGQSYLYLPRSVCA